jgi:hypothetical protein
MGLFDDARAELFRAMREELEKRTLEEAARIFGGGFAEGGPVRFEDRDFGRWNHKADARVRPEHHNCRSGGWTHFELPPELVVPEDGRTGRGSLFGHRAYLMVSEEPEVAVAAAQLRDAIAAERRAFWKIGADGKRVYHDADYLRRGGPAAIPAGEAKLRRRIKRALLATTPRPAEAEHGLW